MRFLKCFNICCSLLIILVFIQTEIYAYDVIVSNGAPTHTTIQQENKIHYTNSEQGAAFDNFVRSTFISFLTLTAILLVCPFLIINSKNRAKEKISSPPASILLKLAGFLPKKHRETLIQEISDMRFEYSEALSEKKFWQARFIVCSYYIGFGWSVVMWVSDRRKEVLGIIPKKD
ncbi:MAG TPA: hypothetical protein VF604_17910 [Pyrinomonadaceae bacterium]|jgi:hypothetical protein